MNPLKGVWKLVRLNLRRDRIKLPIVIAATIFLVAISMPALEDLYSEPNAQALYASSASGSVAARVMGGPIDGANLGAITMVELFLFTSIIVAFIATSAMVRHTRQNEETGRTELIESYSVGRYSQLAAALIVACGASIIVGVLTFISVVPTEGLTTSGSLGMAAAISGVGISFAFITAVLVQLTESSRAANGYAAVAIGVAFILRAIGDGFGKVTADGLGVVSEWPVWLSPLGWGQQTHPFTQENWVNLSYFFVFSVVAGLFGLYLLKKRDKGLAIFATRPGPVRAAKRLRSNLMLSWRLQKTVLLGWLSFFIIFGGMIGAMANEFEDIIQNLYADSQFASTFFEKIGAASFEDVFFSSMYMIFALMATGYAIHALTKIRSEEAKGHLEIILASKAERFRWVMSHVVWAIVGLILLYLGVAISSGVVNSIIADVGMNTVPSKIWQMFSLMPATAVISSIVLLVYGFAPKLTIVISWTVFTVIFFILQFAQLIDLPQFIINLSPFTHLPQIPIDPFQPFPFIVLCLISLSFFFVGLFRFTKRDIAVI